jgi:hypothetical protein
MIERRGAVRWQARLRSHDSFKSVIETATYCEVSWRRIVSSNERRECASRWRYRC